MSDLKRQKVGIWTRRRTTAALAIAFTAEECDKVLLTSMYLAIGNSLRALPSQLGQLTMWRALVQALFIPVVGILGNEFNRIFIIAVGTLVWGGMSVGFGFAHNLLQATVWAALSGIGLALVLPCVQAIIAELYTAFERGRAFGTLFTISALGGVIGSFCAISFGNRFAGDIPVWRIMFWAMAAMAGLSCLFVVTNAIEPRSYYRRVADSKGAAKVSSTADHGEKGRPSTGARVLERGRHIFGGVVLVFRTPSFLLILLGNIIGTIVAGNMGYKVMYLQLLGFSDLATGALAVCTAIGAAFGFLLGGGVGDFLAMKYPNIARPAVNQVSLLLAAPLYVCFLKALPGSSNRYGTGIPSSLDHYTPLYGFMLLLLGFFASWPPSNNAAIFAEVVPESVRTSVYAFDKCIAGAIGALGAPLCGVLAERLFGYHGVPGGEGAHKHRDPHISAARAHANLVNARALEDGLLWMAVIPMILKFFVYGGLYWTLPKDRVEEVDAEEEDGEEGAQQRMSDAEAAKLGGDDLGCAPLEARAPTLVRNVSIRRPLRGEELGMRYASLDASTLRREAIRGLLNPGNKPASQLNPLAVFAGAAYDIKVKDTAHNSQSRAELPRTYRRTGSAVVSRQDLAAARNGTTPPANPRDALSFASLPAAVTADWRRQVCSGGAGGLPNQAAQEDDSHASGQGIGQTLELTNPRPMPQDRQAMPPPGLPKFRASGEPIVGTVQGGPEATGTVRQGTPSGAPVIPPTAPVRSGTSTSGGITGAGAGARSARATPPAWEYEMRSTPHQASRRGSLPPLQEAVEGGGDLRARLREQLRQQGAADASSGAK